MAGLPPIHVQMVRYRIAPPLLNRLIQSIGVIMEMIVTERVKMYVNAPNVKKLFWNKEMLCLANVICYELTQLTNWDF